MFFEQYSHEPNIATSCVSGRDTCGLDALSGMQREQIAVKRKAGNEALKLMDDHLARREWFVGDAISLADICLFAYTHVSDEAGFDLELYPTRHCVDGAHHARSASMSRSTSLNGLPQGRCKRKSPATPAAP